MKRVTIQLVDDVDGLIIDEGAGRTLTFAFDGDSYELDLSDGNIDQFRLAIEPYLSAARRVAVKGSRGSRASSAKLDPSELQAIREWAEAHGIHVAPRGRIAASVREKYEAAQKA